MNTEKSSYIIIYAAVMVLLVALGLSFTHQALSGRQKKNVEIDKMQQILRSLKIEASTDEAETIFNDLIAMLI